MLQSLHYRTQRSQKSHLQGETQIIALQAEAAQLEGSKEAEQDPASSLGKAQHQREGENEEAGACYFFPS